MISELVLEGFTFESVLEGFTFEANKQIDKSVVLKWSINSFDASFNSKAKVKIVRRSYDYPESATDGVVVYEGNDFSVGDVVINSSGWTGYVDSGTGTYTFSNLELESGYNNEIFRITLEPGDTLRVEGSVTGLMVPGGIGLPYDNSGLKFTINKLDALEGDTIEVGFNSGYLVEAGEVLKDLHCYYYKIYYWDSTLSDWVSTKNLQDLVIVFDDDKYKDFVTNNLIPSLFVGLEGKQSSLSFYQDDLGVPKERLRFITYNRGIWTDGLSVKIEHVLLPTPQWDIYVKFRIVKDLDGENLEGDTKSVELEHFSGPDLASVMSWFSSEYLQVSLINDADESVVVDEESVLLSANDNPYSFPSLRNIVMNRILEEMEGWIDYLFITMDVDKTPEYCLDPLSKLVGLVNNNELSLTRQRQEIKSTVSSYRRGGRFDLIEEYIKAITGCDCYVLNWFEYTLVANRTERRSIDFSDPRTLALKGTYGDIIRSYSMSYNVDDFHNLYNIGIYIVMNNILRFDQYMIDKLNRVIPTLLPINVGYKLFFLSDDSELPDCEDEYSDVITPGVLTDFTSTLGTWLFQNAHFGSYSCPTVNGLYLGATSAYSDLHMYGGGTGGNKYAPYIYKQEPISTDLTLIARLNSHALNTNYHGLGLWFNSTVNNYWTNIELGYVGGSLYTYVRKTLSGNTTTETLFVLVPGMYEFKCIKSGSLYHYFYKTTAGGSWVDFCTVHINLGANFQYGMYIKSGNLSYVPTSCNWARALEIME